MFIAYIYPVSSCLPFSSITLYHTPQHLLPEPQVNLNLALTHSNHLNPTPFKMRSSVFFATLSAFALTSGAMAADSSSAAAEDTTVAVSAYEHG